jgi:activator of 2-hydroxyglutaryl-CoA dehydratase
MAKSDATSPPLTAKEDSLYVGIDVGSSFVHYAVLSPNREVLYSPVPLMHFANPLGAIREAWRDILRHFDPGRVVSTAFTGSGATALPMVMEDVIYLYDSVAIPRGAAVIDPHARFIFHIGAKDPYFFELAHIKDKQIIQEWRTGTKCGGGSGTLIEKQCRRLFHAEVPTACIEEPGGGIDATERENLRARNRARLQARMDEMFHRAQAEATGSAEPSEFLARCGVVIQSDLIHKQNEGAKRADNLAGLFRTIAGNYKIDVLGSRAFSETDARIPALATGGVMGNDLIVDHLAGLLGIPIRRPEHFAQIAAIGVAVKAIEDDNRFVFDVSELEAAAERIRSKRPFAAPLAAALAAVHEQTQPLHEDIPVGTEVVIGIDGGSTTTKGALVDLKTGRLLDKLYIKTHGNPEGSLKRVMAYLGRHKDKVIVRGVGATGSARKLYERILVSKKRCDELARGGIERADRITDEITCHALGVKHMNPRTDTIFEIGGQDMKFTRFAEDGTVKEAKMNYSCQAGSGQTLENMAEIIDLKVETSLQEAALAAPRVPIIDSTCGVFMEMDENRLIAEGFSR